LHETFRRLRAEFLPAVQSDTVACDMQFGTILRDTGNQTPLQKAQFEICAHKYVDVSNGEKGFSLLNNCKYGHRVKEGLISLNLLRSPVFPDPHADRGKQEFTYAVYPHAGGLSQETLRRACRLNKPVLPFTGVRGFDAPVCVDCPNVMITQLKKAYGENAIVVRMYESQGKPANASLSVRFAYKAVYETNLLEEDAVPADPAALAFRPFEIKTLEFTL
jgi:alpha-mannosidase